MFISDALDTFQKTPWWQREREQRIVGNIAKIFFNFCILLADTLIANHLYLIRKPPKSASILEFDKTSSRSFVISILTTLGLSLNFQNIFLLWHV